MTELTTAFAHNFSVGDYIVFSGTDAKPKQMKIVSIDSATVITTRRIFWYEYVWTTIKRIGRSWLMQFHQHLRFQR